MQVTTVRLQPAGDKLVDDGYDLDAVALEFDTDGALLDLRFELGRGFDIYYAVPVAPGRRLRLFHVDSAVYELEDVTLVRDPYELEVEMLEWRGELGRVGVDGERTVEYVRLEASASPASYRCEVTVRDRDGTRHLFALSHP